MIIKLLIILEGKGKVMLSLMDMIYTGTVKGRDVSLKSVDCGFDVNTGVSEQ